MGVTVNRLSKSKDNFLESDSSMTTEKTVNTDVLLKTS